MRRMLILKHSNLHNLILPKVFVVAALNDFQLSPINDVSNTQLTRHKRQFPMFGPFNSNQYGFAPQGFGVSGSNANANAQSQNFGGFGQSSALANANAFNQYQGPGGFGSSNSIAGAQSFNSQGPLGGFGASAANSQSQGFHAGPGGITGNAGISGSQSYNLPGGKNIAISYGQGFK